MFTPDMANEKQSIVRLPDSLHRKLKVKAIQEGEKLSSFAERMIKLGLASEAKKKEEAGA